MWVGCTQLCGNMFYVRLGGRWWTTGNYWAAPLHSQWSPHTNLSSSGPNEKPFNIRFALNVALWAWFGYRRLGNRPVCRQILVCDGGAVWSRCRSLHLRPAMCVKCVFACFHAPYCAFPTWLNNIKASVWWSEQIVFDDTREAYEEFIADYPHMT